MDRPKIVEIRRPQAQTEESEVPPEREQFVNPAAELEKEQREQTTQTTPTQQPTTTQPTPEITQPESTPQPEATEQPKPSQLPAVQKPEAEKEKPIYGPDGLTDLERSVLAEMRGRGEINHDEENAILSEAKARLEKIEAEKREREEKARALKEELARQEAANAKEKQANTSQTTTTIQTINQVQQLAPSDPNTQEPVAQVQQTTQAVPPTGPIEEAKQSEKPRIVSGPPWVMRQEKRGGVVLNEQTTLEREKKAEAQAKGMPQDRDPNAPFTDEERLKAADLARRIYERKQREKSIFHKIKKAFGLAKDEPVVA